MWQPPGLSTVKSKKTEGFGVDSKCMCCSGEARFDFAQAGNAAGGAKVSVALEVSENRVRMFLGIASGGSQSRMTSFSVSQEMRLKALLQSDTSPPTSDSPRMKTVPDNRRSSQAFRGTVVTNKAFAKAGGYLPPCTSA